LQEEEKARYRAEMEARAQSVHVPTTSMADIEK
jgi:hypothetical protein